MSTEYARETTTSSPGKTTDFPNESPDADVVAAKMHNPGGADIARIRRARNWVMTPPSQRTS